MAMNDERNDSQNVWNYEEVWTPTYTQTPPQPDPKTIRYAQPKRSGGGKRFVAMLAACAVISAAAGGGAAALVLNNQPKTQVAANNASGSTDAGTQADAGAQPEQQKPYTSVNANTGRQMLSVVEINNKVGPAVVALNCTVTSSTQNPFFQPQTGQASGSGIIISSDGRILTNNHVIDGATQVTVVLDDGTEYEAKLVGKDAATDLAIIKIDATNLPYATLGNSADLEVGEQAVVIGNPLGELGGSVTVGFISALDRNLTIDGTTMHLLQTDAAVNPGNSGGALVNMYGEVVGVVNAKTSATGVEGLGFAIPIDDAKPIIEQLVNNGKVTGRPIIGIPVDGIEDITGMLAQRYGLKEGVYITKLYSDASQSAAVRAGLQIGDRIVTFNEKDVTTSGDLTTIKADLKAGDTVEMTVEREGQIIQLWITLDEE